MIKNPKRKTGEVALMEDAEAQLTQLMRGKHFETRPIAAFEAKLSTIAKNGSGLKEKLPTLIKAIDDALVKVYPHEGHWDDGHRSELIYGYVAIIKRIVNGDPVNIHQMKDLLEFFSVIRKCFEHFYNARH